MYSVYTPTSYERTKNFINCVIVRMIDKGLIEIYYDTSKIIPRQVNQGWNQHMNIYPRNDIRDYSYMIPTWIEQGTENSLWDRKPLGAMQSIINNENKAHLRILQSLVLNLKKKGIKAAIIG